MCMDTGNSTAPVTASSVPDQLQKPKPFRAGGWGRPASVRSGDNARSELQIATDRAEDGDPISPDTNTKICAKSAISTAQREAQQPEHGASEQWPPRRRSAREAGWRATHQPHAADEHNHACAPSKLPPWSLACHPWWRRRPAPTPTPQAEWDRTTAARCAENHRGFRRPETPLTRCRRYPAVCCPPQHTYRLQQSGARRAGSSSFTSSPALAHHHQAPPPGAAPQPRARRARAARARARGGRHAFCRRSGS